ncbi:MAG: DUF3486 family protein [Myxococcales bacterium]|nr:DUF3486 family protein [Myxococcales bacterium]
MKRSRIRTEMQADHLDEAMAHIGLDGWTVDQVCDWAQRLGYTFSRSAWGRFHAEFLASWEESQLTRLQARAFAKEFGGESGHEVADMTGYLLQKRALEVLRDMPREESCPAALVDLARVLQGVTSSRIGIEKLRQTKAAARKAAYEEIESKLRAELSRDQPELWAGLEAWLRGKMEEEQAA